MGVNIKTAGGIAIGGLVGFYLVNKALNYAKQSISEIAEASKWRAYYRHGKDGKMIPPGYSEMQIPDKEDREYVHPEIVAEREKQEKEEAKAAERKQAQEQMKKTDISPITDVIEKILKAYFKTKGVDIDATAKPKDEHVRFSQNGWRPSQDVQCREETKAPEEESEEKFPWEDIPVMEDKVMDAETEEVIDKVFEDISEEEQ